MCSCAGKSSKCSSWPERVPEVLCMVPLKQVQNDKPMEHFTFSASVMVEIGFCITANVIQTHPCCYLIFKFVREDRVASELSEMLTLQKDSHEVCVKHFSRNYDHCVLFAHVRTCVPLVTCILLHYTKMKFCLPAERPPQSYTACETPSGAFEVGLRDYGCMYQKCSCNKHHRHITIPNLPSPQQQEVLQLQNYARFLVTVGSNGHHSKVHTLSNFVLTSIFSYR